MTENITSDEILTKSFFKKITNVPFLIGLAVFILLSGLYLVTMTPDLSFTDSGELAGACYSLGVAHPTGYPLFIILGHIWIKLAYFLSPIKAMNAFAAICTAASAAVFYSTSLLLIRFCLAKESSFKSKKNAKSNSEFGKYSISLIAAAAALIYGTALTIWGQANAIEVYSLQLLTLNSVIYFSLLSSIKDNSKLKLFAALMLGISFSNHLTTILLVPGCIFLFFKSPTKKADFSVTNFKLFGLLLIAMALGGSLYIFPFIRSSSFPDFNWGWVSRGLDKFSYHVLGKQYQVWMFTGMAAFKANFKHYYEIFPLQFAYIGIVPLILGIYKLGKMSATILIFLLITFVSSLLYTLNYNIHDIDTYFVTSYTVLFLIMLMGLYFIARFNKSLIISFFIIPAISVALNYHENNRSDDILVPEYTRILAENIRPNSIIISSQWDYWVSAFWYKQRVEGFRPDVTIIDKELLRRTWYPEQLRHWYPRRMNHSKVELDRFMIDLEKFESHNETSPTIQQHFLELIRSFVRNISDSIPVYITIDVALPDQSGQGNWSADDVKFIIDGNQLIPEGFALRLERRQKIEPVFLRNIDINKFLESLKGKDGHLEKGIASTVAVNLVNIGRYAMFNGDKELATKAFNEALRADKDNKLAKDALYQIENIQSPLEKK
ncbi:MAG: DUF2723 domain-containing protein [Candidatus Kapabacteria bacterium]|nr:DUF2723 domain-containing protein [Candidatus Kapabacteria bacterium]